ncbi:MAG: glycoside hydrolase family 26 protein, partial [Ignavibacteria bacterium]|nr:glycoside hydrolase family 26 protein [Ignavibacteria bacterium]
MNILFKVSILILVLKLKILDTIMITRFIIISFFLIFHISILLAQAKYEPTSGCYIGAFIVNDSQVQGNVDLFEQMTGKEHSMYFSYTGWGQPFPKSWVDYYNSKGCAVQIAFEPNGGLGEVVDGEYIRNWAREARKSGAAIFLRWACEMNGNWVAWYGNPELYIQKFRLIYNIMKEEAPNVAMVWAPNDIPNDPQSPPNNPHSYYPGDAYVDWVGIDFYGVYFYENGTPERKDPREKLRVVYDVYANRKPIIICEWAATHYLSLIHI